MTAEMFRNRNRKGGPELPKGEIRLDPPPAMPDPPKGGMRRLLMLLPMLLMPAGMGMMYLGGGRGAGGASALGGGFMALAMVGMMIPQMMRGAGDTAADLNDERSAYLRYLAAERTKLRQAVHQQHAALAWPNPATGRLTTHASGPRLWERQPTDPDFGEVKIGSGTQPNAMQLHPPEVVPLEELDPVCARALRRFVGTYATIDELPIAVNLLGFGRIQIDGDADTRRALARALVAQCVTAHSPEFVLVAVCASPDRQDQWDWVKWLPHNQHPTEVDALGPARLFSRTVADLERGLLEDLLADRGRFEAHSSVTVDEPLVLVVVDGENVPTSSRLATSGYRGVVVLDVDSALPWRADKLALRLRAQPGDLALVVTERGEEMEEPLGEPDGMSLVQARALAKTLARWRVGRGGGGSASSPTARQVDFCDLLDIPDARTYDAPEYWRVNGASARLRVPIGIDDRGASVDLDIRESAQGGMGPHGMMVGATGSGKSELLRTLVLAMAVRHSSEYLNFVLVDFKGGATFLGMDRLPHTSALITNLADELPLVDRMQDALHGELIRRQELLRATGHSSLLEYERARANGARLAPLPTLFLVIDEFSELLAARRDFINLFVMVGRLGRSLGVHLLLATQRIEEGRVHALEGHLSYRIGLRTFSASESRAVLGVTDAYDAPLSPGMGFLKSGQSSLLRFKAAYVSGALKEARAVKDAPDADRPVRHDVQSFGPEPVALPHRPSDGDEGGLDDDQDDRGDDGHRGYDGDDDGQEPPDTAADDDFVARENTLLHVLIEKLTESGPPAHRVWLPPLKESQPLNALLGPISPHPDRGLTAASWPGGPLTVPVGIIDKPFEQRWDTLVAQLDGADGNVGIVGGSHSGKSNLLRTLVLGLALLNTPAEARFYCLDFGSGGLGSLSGLPHVGSVGTRRDGDLVMRTLLEIVALLDRRERLFSAHAIDSMHDARQRRADGRAPEEDDLADVFLVVDGWFTVRQDFEQLEPMFQQIAARGLSFGVHLVVTSNRWSEIRNWLRDVLGTKFELHLGDPADSAIGMRAAANVPTQPGRGLTEDSMHFLAALPRIDASSSVETLPAATQQAVAAVAAAWDGEAAPSVRTLPALVRQEELPPAEGGPTSKDDLRVAVGLEETAVEPYWWDFGEAAHLVAFGDTETGKTALLRLLLASIVDRYSDDEAKILLADFRRELFETVPTSYLLGYATSQQSLASLVKDAATALTERMPADDIALDALRRRDWWHGPRIFVVVDDLDLVSGSGFGATSPLEPLTGLMPQGADIGLHVIITRSTASGTRGAAEPAVRRAWELGNPALLLSCPREENMIFGSAKPKTLPPGRAQLVTRRGTTLVQLGFAPDGPRAERPS